MRPSAVHSTGTVRVEPIAAAASDCRHPRALSTGDAAFGASIEPIATALLLPLFFAFSGLRTSVQLISGPELWAQAGLILGVAVIGKGVGSAVAARVMGTSWTVASLIGVLLNTRGLVELVVLNIGLDLGILSPVLFSMMVMMALATTLATSPLVSLIVARTRRGNAGSRTLVSYGLRPSGRTSSFALCVACSMGVPALHGGIGAFPGGYSDSMGCQTLSTLPSNRSPISRSVTVPCRCGYLRTNAPKLNPS
jgi:hypothetical protein